MDITYFKHESEENELKKTDVRVKVSDYIL